ncbi:MAG: amino acid-binding ACT domain protein, partial [Candidatus Methanosuratincola sp.]
APALGYGVVEVRAKSDAVGVISHVTKYISDAGISIRQILAEDPELNPDPKLMIITDTKIPGDVISKLLTIPTVTKVSVS